MFLRYYLLSIKVFQREKKEIKSEITLHIVTNLQFWGKPQDEGMAAWACSMC